MGFLATVLPTVPKKLKKNILRFLVGKIEVTFLVTNFFFHFWQLATLVADDTATKVNVIETVYIESKDAKYKET